MCCRIAIVPPTRGNVSTVGVREDAAVTGIEAEAEADVERYSTVGMFGKRGSWRAVPGK